jgi:hypothetical protein
VEDICRRNGKMTNPEIAEEDDVLFGEFVELRCRWLRREKPDGQTHKSNLYIQIRKTKRNCEKLIDA